MNFRDFKALIMINQFAFSVLGPIIMMVAISVCVRNFFGIDVVHMHYTWGPGRC